MAAAGEGAKTTETYLINEGFRATGTQATGQPSIEPSDPATWKFDHVSFEEIDGDLHISAEVTPLHEIIIVAEDQAGPRSLIFAGYDPIEGTPNYSSRRPGPLSGLEMQLGGRSIGLTPPTSGRWAVLTQGGDFEDPRFRCWAISNPDEAPQVIHLPPPITDHSIALSTTNHAKHPLPGFPIRARHQGMPAQALEYVDTPGLDIRGPSGTILAWSRRTDIHAALTVHDTAAGGWILQSSHDNIPIGIAGQLPALEPYGKVWLSINTNDSRTTTIEALCIQFRVQWSASVSSTHTLSATASFSPYRDSGAEVLSRPTYWQEADLVDTAGQEAWIYTSLVDAGEWHFQLSSDNPPTGQHRTTEFDFGGPPINITLSSQ